MKRVFASLLLLFPLSALAAFVQVNSNERQLSTDPVELTMTVTAGNTLFAFAIEDVNQNVTFTTQAGSTSAWTEIAALDRDNVGDFYFQEAAQATVISSGTVTIRAAATAASYLGIIVIEISNVSSYDTQNYNRAVASPINMTATPTAQPGMALLFIADWGVNGPAPVPPGWSDAGTHMEFGGTDIVRLAYTSYASTTALAPSVADSGGPWHWTIALLTENSGGSGGVTEVVTLQSLGKGFGAHKSQQLGGMLE